MKKNSGVLFWGGNITTVKTRSWYFYLQCRFTAVHQYFPNKCTLNNDVVIVSKSSVTAAEAVAASRRRHHKCIILCLFVCIKPEWYFFCLVDFIFVTIDVKGGRRSAHPFCKRTARICTHFPMLSISLYTFVYGEKLVPSFLEISTNALGNKTMYIIACCLQFHSFKLSPYKNKNCTVLEFPSRLSHWTAKI